MARLTEATLALALLAVVVGCTTVAPITSTAPGDSPGASFVAPSSSPVAVPSFGDIASPTASIPPTSGPPTSVPPTDTPALTAKPTKTPKPTAAPGANLVIGKFEIVADAVVAEMRFDAVFVVRNTGSEDAGPFQAAVLAENTEDGVKSESEPFSVEGGLAAGDSVEVTITMTLPRAAVWKLTAKADSGDTVNETNENDNERDATVRVVAGLPDLAWYKDGFSVFDQAEVTADGNKIELQAKFQNIGTATYASSPFVIGITWYRDEDSASGNLTPFTHADEIEPGATVDLSKIDYLPGPGTYTLYAYLDDGRVVAELNEDNNEAQAGITIN